jgi:hypothetical protein
MLRTKQVKSVVVFCGHSDIELKNQTTQEVSLLQERNTTNPYYNYLKAEFPEMDEDTLCGKLPQSTNFRVIFGSSNLKKANVPTTETLFIWDESHYAQSLNNAPYAFFGKIGVSPDGDREILSAKGNYFLSVSATPFSEIAANHHQSQNKGFVTLAVSDRYNSVEIMLRDSRIRFYNHKRLTDKFKAALGEAVANYTASPTSYVLVRTSEKNEHHIIAGIPRSWRVVYFNSKEDKEENSVGKDVWRRMNTVPEKNTVIIIRGRCRMGEVVVKKYVSLMFETSCNSKTDTILQSFVGRACGYPENTFHLHHICRVQLQSSCQIPQYHLPYRYVQQCGNSHWWLLW